MFQLERQAKMLEYINEKGQVRTRDLSRIFKISAVTARADVNDLAGQGLIVKTHGGALSIKDRLSMEIPINNKMLQNLEQKRVVAGLAAGIIKDNDIIILDAGSTTLEIAKLIKHRRLTVITNDIKIGEMLALSDGITLNITGGTVERGVYTLMGMEVISYFHHIRANKLFLGVDALDVEWGVSNRTYKEVDIKKAMISAAKEVIAVTDSSKIGKQVFAHLCDPSTLDMLITDQISKQHRDALEKAGVQVILPQKEA